jgi:hypothetical protein
MANQFCYSKAGVAAGPVDSIALKELVSSGALHGGDLVRRQDKQDWVRVDSIPELERLLVQDGPVDVLPVADAEPEPSTLRHSRPVAPESQRPATRWNALEYLVGAAAGCIIASAVAAGLAWCLIATEAEALRRADLLQLILILVALAPIAGAFVALGIMVIAAAPDRSVERRDHPHDS